MRRLTLEPDQLGDGPIWDVDLGRLHWLDIVGKRLSSCREDGSDLRREALHETPGSHASRGNGGRIIAFRRRIALFNQQGQEEDGVDLACVDLSRERFNDGACDNHGRFWVGTMDRQLREPVGALYCLLPDHTLHRMATGFGISNGIAWSPDFDRMYQCDSLFPRIFSYPFDHRRGLIGERRVFAEMSADMGVPDGCAIDVEGNLWVATPGVNRILCLDPSGRMRGSIGTPTAWPSSLTFGGAGLATMFITSLQPRERLVVPQARLASSDSEVCEPPTSNQSQSDDGQLYATVAPTPGLRAFPYRG
jgi:L-arabinonolactonase